MTDINKRQEERKKKADPWLHLFSILPFSLRSGKVTGKQLLKKIEADEKWEGTFLPLMTVLQFIPNLEKETAFRLCNLM